MSMNIKRRLVLVLGFIALGLGTLGMVVPLLPTTPLVLLAAGCFSYSSDKFYEWIKKNRLFGPYIENYREKSGFTKSFKIRNIILLWASLAVSMFLIRTVFIYVLLSIVGVSVTTHLLMTKTRVEGE